MSGNTNGTTMNLFATMCLRPANVVDRPHRHIAAAINYFFAGRGHSVVDGHRYDWKAGDLMSSAPGWAIHHHASDDEDVYELTIQDSPLHLAMDSLWWQEDLRRPARLVGDPAPLHACGRRRQVADRRRLRRSVGLSLSLMHFRHRVVTDA